MITILVSAVNSFWIAAAAAVSVWALFRFVWHSNAATRHAAWWAVLVAVVAIPLAPRLDVTQRPAPRLSEPLAQPLPVVMVTDAASTPVLATRAQAPVEMPSGGWIVWAVGLWAAVFAYRVARVGHSYLYLRRIKNRAQPAPAELQVRFDLWRTGRAARLLVSKEIASPMAVGFLRPAVILPEALLGELNQVELDHVLLHELAHLARRDDWTNLLARVTGAVLGLHPVVAWSLSQLAKERELACDDWVVARNGGEARTYAASLTRVFELSTARRGDLLASAMTSQLGSRIERLLARGRTFVPHVSVEAVAAGIVVLMALVIGGAQSPQWIVFAQERARPVQRAEPVVPRSPNPVQREVAQARPVTPVAPVERQSTLEFLAERDAEMRALESEIRAQVAQVRAAQARLRALAESQQTQSMQERMRAQEAQLAEDMKQLERLRQAERTGQGTQGTLDFLTEQLRAKEAQVRAVQARLRAVAEGQEAQSMPERMRAEQERVLADETKLVEMVKQLETLKQIEPALLGGKLIHVENEDSLSEALRDLNRQIQDIDAQLRELARDPAVSERPIQQAMIEVSIAQAQLQRAVAEQNSTVEQLRRAMAELDQQIKAMREQKR